MAAVAVFDHLGFVNNSVVVSLRGNVIFLTKPNFSTAGGQRLLDSNIVVSHAFCLKVKICTNAFLGVCLEDVRANS